MNDIYSKARIANSIRARVADGGVTGRPGVGRGPHFLSPTVGSAIDKESQLEKRLFLRENAPIPPESGAELGRYRPKELLDFVAARQRDTDWAAVLADPTAAAAMRQLQRRMHEINGTPGTFTASRWAARARNGQDGAPPGPKHAQALCSARNPLSYDALREHNPLAELPRLTARPAPRQPAQATSLWTSGASPTSMFYCWLPGVVHAPPSVCSIVGRRLGGLRERGVRRLQLQVRLGRGAHTRPSQGRQGLESAGADIPGGPVINGCRVGGCAVDPSVHCVSLCVLLSV